MNGSLLILLFAASFLGTCGCGAAVCAAAPPPPNVVLILIDEMGWRDLGCTGSTFYETPNIDHLAEEGIRFTTAYAPCPVCSPSRASILTGEYPARIGLTDYLGGKATGRLLPAPYLDHLPLELPKLPSSLHAAGYQTWHIGKWHLGPEPYWPKHQGFDVNVGGCAFGHPPTYFSPYRIPTLKDGPEGEYLTDRLTDEAIKLIKNRDPKRPFYLNLCHYAVHTPIQAPAKLIEKYKAKAHALGLDQQKVMIEGEHFPTIQKRDRRVKRRIVQSNPVYAAMIENLDTNVGRLLQTLDELKLSGNTIVIFTSDNGGLSTAEGSPTSNLPLLDGKGWAYEGGLRVPLMIRWPGVIQPGTTSDAPVVGTDLYPTILDAVGIGQPKSVIDGISLFPFLKHGNAVPARDLFWHYPHYGNQGGTPASVVRSGDWKLIEFFEGDHLELYNLKDDPGESKNVANKHPDEVKLLHAKLLKWQRAVSAKMPTTNPAWKDAPAER